MTMIIVKRKLFSIRYTVSENAVFFTCTTVLRICYICMGRKENKGDDMHDGDCYT